MAVLTVEKIVIGGVEPTFVAAAAGGDTFINGGEKTFVVVKNGGGSSITVTSDDTGSVSPPSAVAFNADVDVTIAAGAEKWIGPFPKGRFTSTVALAYSGVTTVTVAAVEI